MSTRSESESEAASKQQDNKNQELSKPGTPASVHSDRSAPSTPPAGVNRRTAVLFSKKTFRKENGKDNGNSNTSTPPRKPGRPPKNKGTQEKSGTDSPQPPVLELMIPSPGRSPRSPGTRKRSASAIASSSDMAPSPPKRTASMSEPLTSAFADPPDLTKRETFMTYRHSEHIRSSSESESTSGISSSDESMSDTSSTGSSDSRSGRTRRNSFDPEELIPLEPLDLVWAKCRGYPWYPALIINPKMPKTGYFHNGVPIPVPPEDVLQMQKKFDEIVYLVLFFDTKRTWQWLPRNKLEPLGVDSGLDKGKLLENKKPNVRKAVQKAYEKAILHRCSVTGEPNPLSGDSSSED